MAGSTPTHLHAGMIDSTLPPQLGSNCTLRSTEVPAADGVSLLVRQFFSNWGECVDGRVLAVCPGGFYCCYYCYYYCRMQCVCMGVKGMLAAAEPSSGQSLNTMCCHMVCCNTQLTPTCNETQHTSTTLEPSRTTMLSTLSAIDMVGRSTAQNTNACCSC